MPKEQKPAEESSGIAKQSMEQARGAVDIYFDYLKRTISSTPSGGTEFGEKLKSYAEKNITTTHEFVKQLSQAKDFQEIVRIQTEFVQSLVNAFGEQTKSLTEAYTQAAADIVKKPLAGMS
jgi:hypothetical protein